MHLFTFNLFITSATVVFFGWYFWTQSVNVSWFRWQESSVSRKFHLNKEAEKKKIEAIWIYNINFYTHSKYTHINARAFLTSRQKWNIRLVWHIAIECVNRMCAQRRIYTHMVLINEKQKQRNANDDDDDEKSKNNPTTTVTKCSKWKVKKTTKYEQKAALSNIY